MLLKHRCLQRCYYRCYSQAVLSPSHGYTQPTTPPAHQALLLPGVPAGRSRCQTQCCGMGFQRAAPICGGVRGRVGAAQPQQGWKRTAKPFYSHNFTNPAIGSEPAAVSRHRGAALSTAQRRASKTQHRFPCRLRRSAAAGSRAKSARPNGSPAARCGTARPQHSPARGRSRLAGQRCDTAAAPAHPGSALITALRPAPHRRSARFRHRSVYKQPAAPCVPSDPTRSHRPVRYRPHLVQRRQPIHVGGVDAGAAAQQPLHLLGVPAGAGGQEHGALLEPDAGSPGPSVPPSAAPRRHRLLLGQGALPAPQLLGPPQPRRLGPLPAQVLRLRHRRRRTEAQGAARSLSPERGAAPPPPSSPLRRRRRRAPSARAPRHPGTCSSRGGRRTCPAPPRGSQQPPRAAAPGRAPDYDSRHPPRAAPVPAPCPPSRPAGPAAIAAPRRQRRPRGPRLRRPRGRRG